MKPTAGGKRLLRKPKRYTSAIIIILIIVGLADAAFVAISTNASNHELLQGRAQAVANALPTQDIRQLEGSGADLDKPAYKRLKETLRMIEVNNPDVDYVYLMTRRENSALYLVDGEQPNSSHYAGPGNIYPEASQQLLNAFTAREPFTEGPLQDRWGLWVSGVAPIIDPSTQRVIAVVGMDTAAANFYRQTLIYSLVPICLTAIPLAGLLRDRKLAAKEREITHLKNQFVSIASHELRSPMSGLLWAIQRLLKPGDASLTAEQQELLTSMYRSAASSMATINEILDFSIFERNESAKAQDEPIELRSVAEHVRDTLELGAQENQISVIIDGSWPEKAFTSGDLGAIKRALMNVVSNAIKYSHPLQQVELLYSANEQMHIIGVRDHGIGIPKDDQAKVLEGYYRAKNATQVQSHGTGLGLWITRLVVQQHGGLLKLESEENKGTTVWLSLPKHDPTTNPKQ